MNCDLRRLHDRIFAYWTCLYFSLSVPNFKRISSFHSKVIRGSQLSPRRRPLPGGAGRPKFNHLETVTTFTYKSSLVKIAARNFELSW